MEFGHLEGVPQPQLRGLITMLINHLSAKSWDDPPRMCHEQDPSHWTYGILRLPTRLEVQDT